MMTNNDANKFAFDSFVTAFAPGNETMLDQYFSPDLILFNHSVSKQFDLNDLKSRLPNIHKKYADLKSEIKDIIIENDRIAFHVKQNAFSVPDNEHVNLDVMNFYKLFNGKVKEWQMWVNQIKAD
ncbi:nuclear transport factor 2 family protein [Legionella sp. D16C41]|uniref:nuclear transport factor 2 family protein n=1 Tax=Legionella sp. D16C41 TaxID=3402688 RepID=UPI003AF85507